LIQKQLKAYCGQDDLICGFLSKAKGQLLRIATCLHVLFKINTPDNIDQTIDEQAIKAAIDFIEVCCDHAFMITGRHNILHRVGASKNGMHIFRCAQFIYIFILIDDCLEISPRGDDAKAGGTKATAQYTILLPGKALYLTALNNARKFRNRGNKEGGYQAFEYLQNEGLGTLEEHMIPGQKTKVCICSAFFNTNQYVMVHLQFQDYN